MALGPMGTSNLTQLQTHRLLLILVLQGMIYTVPIFLFSLIVTSSSLNSCFWRTCLIAYFLIDYKSVDADKKSMLSARKARSQFH